MSPGSPEATAPSSAGLCARVDSCQAFWNAWGGSWERAVSPRRGLDGASESKRQAGWGWGRPDHVSPAPWSLWPRWPGCFYTLCVCLQCAVCRSRLTPECWGLRNPPGGKCSNRQEVSWSWAALLTHCDSEPLPGQSAPWSSHLAGRCVWGTGAHVWDRGVCQRAESPPPANPQTPPAPGGHRAGVHRPSAIGSPHVSICAAPLGQGDEFKAGGQ